MVAFETILLIAAVVLLALRAWGIGPARPDLGWLALCLVTVTFIF